MAIFKNNLPGCAAGGCTCTPPVIDPRTGCFACTIPDTITLTWYWYGYNQNPCTTGAGGSCQVYGPTSNTLTFLPTPGIWVSAWIQAPCAVVSEPIVGFGPFGCLYVRFTWNCGNAQMAIDFAANSSGGSLNSCVSGVTHGQITNEVLATRACPFFTSFVSSPVGTPCGSDNTFFAGGSLAP